jgi:hypothetical protein
LKGRGIIRHKAFLGGSRQRPLKTGYARFERGEFLPFDTELPGSDPKIIADARDQFLWLAEQFDDLEPDLILYPRGV